jgi:hypothetical protein
MSDCRVWDMSGHVRECTRVMLRGHQCFCSEIGHENVLVSCVQRTFLETMFNAIIIFIICMKNSYIINKTYEINELQYNILYVHVHYHFVIRDGGPALKNPIVSTTHDSDVRTRPPDTWLNESQATLSWDNPMSLEMRGHWPCPGTCPGHFHLSYLLIKRMQVPWTLSYLEEVLRRLVSFVRVRTCQRHLSEGTQSCHVRTCPDMSKRHVSNLRRWDPFQGHTNVASASGWGHDQTLCIWGLFKLFPMPICIPFTFISYCCYLQTPLIWIREYKQETHSKWWETTSPYGQLE